MIREFISKPLDFIRSRIIMTFAETEGLKRQREMVERQDKDRETEETARQITIDRINNDPGISSLLANRRQLREALRDAKQAVLDCEAFIQVCSGGSFRDVMNRNNAQDALPELQQNIVTIQRDINNIGQMITKRETWLSSPAGRLQASK